MFILTSLKAETGRSGGGISSVDSRPSENALKMPPKYRRLIQKSSFYASFIISIVFEEDSLK